MTKTIIAVLIAVAAAACQAETPEARVFQLEASDAIAEAYCQRYADCAFDGDAGPYYDQCVHWTKISICGDTDCTDERVTYAADDVDGCVAALSEQVCRSLLDTREVPAACNAWSVRSTR